MEPRASLGPMTEANWGCNIKLISISYYKISEPHYLEEQSDQGLHCLLFHLHLFDEIPKRFGLFSQILGRL